MRTRKSELIHVAHLIWKRADGFKRDPPYQDNRGKHSRATKLPRPQSFGQQRATKYEQERISRQVITNADVYSTAEHIQGVNDEGREQPNESRLARLGPSVNSPTEGRERKQQKWQRCFEREGHREVVPPAAAAVHAQKSRRMSFVVVTYLSQNAENEIGRNHVRQKAG